jgi:hypothetical protein
VILLLKAVPKRSFKKEEVQKEENKITAHLLIKVPLFDASCLEFKLCICESMKRRVSQIATGGLA